MNKRIIFIGVLISLIVIATSVLLFFPSESKKYNVILIVSDALRKDVLGCYGGDAETPNIDWLAQNGTMFENAYSTAPCTMPSSVSMFTGNYARTYEILKSSKKPKKENSKKRKNKRYSYVGHHFYVPDNEVLLGEVLKEANYVLKCDIENALAARSNTLQDFDNFREMTDMKPGEIHLVEKVTGIRNIGYNLNYYISSKYDRMYDLLSFLLNAPENQPFFVVKWFSDPHSQYHPPEKFMKKIPMDTTRLEKDARYYTELRTTEMKSQGQYGKDYLKYLYKAEVASVDERVGFIIKALKEKDLLKNTIIIFTSDHGEFLSEKGRWGHGNRYHNILVNVPLIYMGPGIPAGNREKTVVSHLGLMPSIEDLLDLEGLEDLQGKSYARLLKEKTLADRIVYFDRHKNNIMKNPNIDKDGLLMNGYKLTFNRNIMKKKESYVLYSLRDDPHELINVGKKHPYIFRQMLKEIIEIRKENQQRLEDNLLRMSKNLNLDKIQKKTIQELKALGYIN